MSSLQGQRIALVTNIPRPYRVPLYEGINQRIEEAGGSFQVFFYSDLNKHIRRKGTSITNGRYPHTAVYGYEIPLGYERVVSIPTPLLPALKSYQPTAVICGTFGIAGYLTWWYAHRHHIPYIQWSGAIPHRELQSPLVNVFIQRFLTRRAQGAITYGTAAADYLVQLGLPKEKIVVGVNAVNTQFFMEKSQEAKAETAEWKNKPEWQGLHFLLVGSLIKRKGIENVLSALTLIKESIGAFHLHLVGDGPLKTELQTQAQKGGFENALHFWGNQPFAKMPFFYALADCLIFPSLYDVWGLILNEAMSCGLPVISSSLAGATRDLIEDGINGLVVHPQNVPALAEAIKTMTDAKFRTRMGLAAAATIQAKATIQHSVNAFLQAIHLALLNYEW